MLDDHGLVLNWTSANVLGPILKTLMWRIVCNRAIKFGLAKVQSWLLSRHELAIGMELYPGDTIHAPHTLDFVAAIAPDFGLENVANRPMTQMALVYWHCARNRTTVDSLMPQTPKQWESLFDADINSIPEWWLQCHVAGGHPIVLPQVGKLMMQTASNSYVWLQDALERSIPILMESDDDPSVHEPSVLPADDD
ncbi:hypothetical protein BC828DRAFT_374552 [Blastocladiella britannica]|nr:hypothetical protein BC828DRAFT_374552 [Blastocladiella britannica]